MEEYARSFLTGDWLSASSTASSIKRSTNRPILVLRVVFSTSSRVFGGFGLWRTWDSLIGRNGRPEAHGRPIRGPLSQTGTKSSTECRSLIDYRVLPVFFRNRHKSRMELIRVSAAVMGIEFAYAAETAFVSPTLLGIGLQVRLPRARVQARCLPSCTGFWQRTFSRFRFMRSFLRDFSWFALVVPTFTEFYRVLPSYLPQVSR